MEQNPENYDFGLKDANVKIMNRNTDNVIKSHKCNQCSYSSSHTGHLETKGRHQNKKNFSIRALPSQASIAPKGGLPLLEFFGHLFLTN